MERIAFDILSFPDMTTEGNTCVLVICDYFTKWVEAFALVYHRASTVADVLVTEVFLRFGVPRYIHSDQAPDSMSELMTELCQLLEVQCTRTCPYRPQSDGLVERFNRTLINMLSKFCCERKDDWDQHLPFLLCAYRATVNESTGCSPNLLMLGRETTMPIDLMYPSPQYSPYRCHVEYVAWAKSALEDNFERARQQLGVAAERQKRNYDVRTKDRHFRVGDFVLRFYPPNLKNKLSSPYIGPYRIMAKLGAVTYSIQKTPSTRPITVHVDHLKLFHTVNPPVSWVERQSDSSHETCSVESDSNNGQGGVDGDVSVEVEGDDNTVEAQDDEPETYTYRSRTLRNRQLPGRYADYYMG